ncbi:MAG: hypothetical protein A4E48_00151 [Methanosaeta sp. PtaU1.Bin060]|nr:MAG: hypothetical protein A4E48_00151 [Methanosaeta sp. PtaU1.Bin060]
MLFYKNEIALSGSIALIFLLLFVGCSSGQETPAIVNVMIDADVQHAPTAEQSKIAGDSLINMTNQIVPKDLNATIYVTNDMIAARRLAITYQGTLAGIELAMHGTNADEKLSGMSAADQEKTLNKSHEMLYSCYICGGDHVDIKGFRPQAFDQNEDTFKILEKLKVAYDAGFQAGLIYRPGHENDTWPYPIEGYGLYAVPVSTYPLNEESVYLYDRYIKEDKKLSGAQWYDLLTKKFDESSTAGEPMVVIFSTLVSGSGDYLNAYKKFIDYASGKGARFVTTLQLTDMAKARQASGQIPTAIPSSENRQPVNASEKGVLGSCPTCDKTDTEASSILNVTVISKNRCENCSQNSTNLTGIAV